MTGRWLLLGVSVLASLAVAPVISGAWIWLAAGLIPLSWVVARHPDSLAPLGWVALAIVAWILGGSQSPWGAAVVALALGAVHMAAALTARTAPDGPPWIRSDWYRFAGFLAATAAGMGVVMAVMALPALQGLIWVPAAVFLFAAVVVLVRLGVDGRAATTDRDFRIRRRMR